MCQGSRRIFWKLFSHFVIDGARPEPVIFYANATFKEHYIHISIKETQYFKKSMDDKNYGKSNEELYIFILA